MSKTASRVLWAVALCVLAVALFLFNRPTPAAPVPEGHAVGERLPDFTLTDLTGVPFVLSEHRGQTVIINLWATWCDPCLKELPHFDRIQRENPEDVAVLAVHSGLIIEDIPAFVAGLDSALRYAVDEAGDFTALVGASAALPHTLVLDPDGVVIYNQPGSVTYALLAELVEMAQGK